MKIPVFYASSEETPGGVTVTYDNGDTVELAPYKYAAAETVTNENEEAGNGGETE